MILAPLKQLPKEELYAARGPWPAPDGPEIFVTSDILAAINAHRAKLDKVVSEWVAVRGGVSFSNEKQCECYSCTSIRDLIRRLKEES